MGGGGAKRIAYRSRYLPHPCFPQLLLSSLLLPQPLLFSPPSRILSPLTPPSPLLPSVPPPLSPHLSLPSPPFPSPPAPPVPIPPPQAQLEGEHETSFFETPTYVLALVLAFFLIAATLFGWATEGSMSWLRRHNRPGLAAAVARMVEELTTVGLLSLILIALQGPVTSICIEVNSSWNSWMLARSVVDVAGEGCRCCLLNTKGIGECRYEATECNYRFLIGEAFCDCGYEEECADLAMYAQAAVAEPGTIINGVTAEDILAANTPTLEQYGVNATFIRDLVIAFNDTSAEQANARRRRLLDADREKGEESGDVGGGSPPPTPDGPKIPGDALRANPELGLPGLRGLPGLQGLPDAASAALAARSDPRDGTDVPPAAALPAGPASPLPPPQAQRRRRRELSESDGDDSTRTEGSCHGRVTLSEKCPAGKTQAVSAEALEQVHLLIFVVTVTHVACCLVLYVVVRLRIYYWRRWQNSTDPVSQRIDQAIERYYDTLELSQRHPDAPGAGAKAAAPAASSPRRGADGADDEGLDEDGTLDAFEVLRREAFNLTFDSTAGSFDEGSERGRVRDRQASSHSDGRASDAWRAADELSPTSRRSSSLASRDASATLRPPTGRRALRVSHASRLGRSPTPDAASPTASPASLRRDPWASGSAPSSPPSAPPRREDSWAAPAAPPPRPPLRRSSLGSEAPPAASSPPRVEAPRSRTLSRVGSLSMARLGLSGRLPFGASRRTGSPDGARDAERDAPGGVADETLQRALRIASRLQAFKHVQPLELHGGRLVPSRGRGHAVGRVAVNEPLLEEDEEGWSEEEEATRGSGEAWAEKEEVARRRRGTWAGHRHSGEPEDDAASAGEAGPRGLSLSAEGGGSIDGALPPKGPSAGPVAAFELSFGAAESDAGDAVEGRAPVEAPGRRAVSFSPLARQSVADPGATSRGPSGLRGLSRSAHVSERRGLRARIAAQQFLATTEAMTPRVPSLGWRNWVLEWSASIVLCILPLRGLTRERFKTLETSFRLTHRLPPSFDFVDFLLRSAEEDFASVVGLSVEFWLIIIIFWLIAGPFGYPIVIFMPIAASLSLLAGAKIVRIIRFVAGDTIGLRHPDQQEEGEEEGGEEAGDWGEEEDGEGGLRKGGKESGAHVHEPELRVSGKGGKGGDAEEDREAEPGGGGKVGDATSPRAPPGRTGAAAAIASAATAASRRPLRRGSTCSDGAPLRPHGSSSSDGKPLRRGSSSSSPPSPRRSGLRAPRALKASRRSSTPRRLDSDVFWFNRPPLLLVPIKVAIFLCSFFYSGFLFFAWQLGPRSCAFDTSFYPGWVLPWWTVILFTSVIFAHVCWGVFPNYCIAVQLGSDWKAHMLPKRLVKRLLAVARATRKRVRAKKLEEERLRAAAERDAKGAAVDPDISPAAVGTAIVKAGRSAAARVGLGLPGDAAAPGQEAPAAPAATGADDGSVHGRRRSEVVRGVVRRLARHSLPRDFREEDE